MTGLDPDKDVILEVHCYITDGRLNYVDKEGWGCVVQCSERRLALMDEWCTATHGQSGLIDEVRLSTLTPEAAAEGLHKYITKWVPDKACALLAGSSVHYDARFLRKEPWRKIVDHLHYRILDVSSLKEAFRRWALPSVVAALPRKKEQHRARPDVLESIDEARYYQGIIGLGSVKWWRTAEAARDADGD